MTDAIATGLVLCLLVTGFALGFAGRAWLHDRRRRRELDAAIWLLENAKGSKLTPWQRELAKRFYYDRYAVKGREADKQRLEELETLEEE